MEQKEKDKRFLDIAIDLAEKARGLTSPNPMVGALVVRNGKILSTGYHKMAGGPHAEIEAIKNAKSSGIKDLSDCDLFVSLEPCSIFAKTPPCTEAIIREGFKNVILASRDPNPKINGNGIKILKEAGIKVREGTNREKVEKQNEVFFKNTTDSKPFISCKIASSIDAKLATHTGSSKWITSETSRKYVKEIRSYNDCILTGINTVIKDDPMLMHKEGLPGHKEYTRVILDSRLRIPLTSKIVASAAEIKTVVFYAEDHEDGQEKIDVLKKKGVILKKIHLKKDTASKGLCLEGVTEVLYKDHKAWSILVEAGPSLVTAFLRSGLIDKLYFFLAPKIIGGDSKYTMFKALGVDDISDALRIRFDSIKKTGSDILITAYPNTREKR